MKLDDFNINQKYKYKENISHKRRYQYNEKKIFKYKIKIKN